MLSRLPSSDTSARVSQPASGSAHEMALVRQSSATLVRQLSLEQRDAAQQAIQVFYMATAALWLELAQLLCIKCCLPWPLGALIGAPCADRRYIVSMNVPASSIARSQMCRHRSRRECQRQSIDLATGDLELGGL